MHSAILYRSLQPPTAVAAACSAPSKDGHSVLLLQDTNLTCCAALSNGLEQGPSWRAPASILQMLLLPSNHLLLLAVGGHCSLHSWQPDQAADHNTAPALVAHAILAAPVGSARNLMQPFGCVISSNILSAPVEHGIASLVAVSYMPGVLHLIKAQPAQEAGTMQLQTKGLHLHHALLSCSIPDGPPPVLASIRVHSRVLALTWLSPAEQQVDSQGRSLLAILHEFSNAGEPPVLHIDCVAVDWLEATISPGPWSIRNVHPTTRLLHPYPGSASLPPGIMAVSSKGISYCTCLGSSLQEPSAAAAAATAAAHEQAKPCKTDDRPSSSRAATHARTAAAAALPGTVVAQYGGFCVHRQQLVSWVLQGLPLSCVALSEACWVVGDTRAGLYLLHLPVASGSSVAVQPIQTSCPLAVPDVLLYVSLTTQQYNLADSPQPQQLQHLGDTADAMPVASRNAQQLQQQQQQSTARVGSNSHQQGQASEASEAQDIVGLLIVGSRCSSSQVVGLTRGITTMFQQQQQGQQCPVWPVLQSAFMPSIAGAQAAIVYRDPDGHLPEQQLLVACGSAPRGKLALARTGAGLMPFLLDGPTLPSDAELFAITQHPACDCKQPLQHQQQQQRQQLSRQGLVPLHHSMLGFSFPSANATSVLSLDGATFRQLQLEGLSQDEASLLLVGVPGGWLVQVMATGLRVLDASDGWRLRHQWSATGTISLAAAAAAGGGGQLVVACGASLTCLSVSCCDGALTVTATAELQQQASALGLLTLSGGQLVVAAGLWVDNSVLLMPWPTADPAAAAGNSQPPQPQQLQVCCAVDLDANQPRSVAVLPVGASDVLLVGTNSGIVLMWDINTKYSLEQQQEQRQKTAGEDAIGNAQSSAEHCWSLSHSREVQVSNTSVSLQQMWLPSHRENASGNTSTSSGGGGHSSSQAVATTCVYAHAGAGAIFRPNEMLVALQQQQQQKQQQLQADTASAASAATPTAACEALLPATRCVQISRLCGSEACLNAAPVHTPDMPFSMAWVSNSHSLCFGGIAAEHKLRWRNRGLSGTPLTVRVHQPTNTLLVLLAADEYASRPQQQQQQLLVLDAKSLEVLMAVALAPGHTYTMLEVLDLPATSQQQQQQDGQSTSVAAYTASVSATGRAAGRCSSSGSRAAVGLQQHASSSSNRGDSREASPGCLPFIVLGSSVAVDMKDIAANAASSSSAAAADAAADVKRVGLLSFFELKCSLVQPQLGTAGASSSKEHSGQPQEQPLHSGNPAAAELRYELLLHGLLPLLVTPSSACTVVPALLPSKQQQQQEDGPPSSSGAGRSAAAAAAANPAQPPKSGMGMAIVDAAAQQGAAAALPPLLALGSETGVTLLRVLVDDAAVAEHEQLQEHLAKASKVADSAMDLDTPGSSDQQPPAAAAARTTPPHQQQQQRHSSTAATTFSSSSNSEYQHYGRVLLQELSSCNTLFGGATSLLRSSGSSIIAAESLGPVTVLKAIAASPNGWVQLVPVGMDDASRTVAVDAVPVPAPSAQDSRLQGSPSATQRGFHTGLRCAGRETGQSAQQQQQQEQVRQQEAVLVAVHPSGLMLLQRDLVTEQSHIADMLHAAEQAWEAGARPVRPNHTAAARQGILPPQPLLAVAPRGPPWQGAGEAAPWAAAAAAGDHLAGAAAAGAAAGGAAGAGRGSRGGRGAAAAGVGASDAVARGVFGLMNTSPGLAPLLLPSAAFAPAPGSTLLCPAQLGLHSRPMQTADAQCSTDHHRNTDESTRDVLKVSADGLPASDSTVLCISASGCVSVAQMLLTFQAVAMLELQHEVVSNTQGRRGPEQLQLEPHIPPVTSYLNRGRGPLQCLLRGMKMPDPAASYDAYDQGAGAVAAAGTWQRVTGADEQAAAPGSVDGDLLLQCCGSEVDGAGDVLVLQQLSWQDVL